VYETLKKMGVEDLAKRPFNELSAGQHQKVMLARGLVQQPEIILLDEPTANLDVKHQLGVTKLLRDISHDDGVLVIMICHDLNIASKYADSILMMKDGTIYAAGTPEEVLIEENIREVYDVECRVIEDEGRPHVILREGTL
jgi:iron complex transport system ATP-binding protein